MIGRTTGRRRKAGAAVVLVAEDDADTALLYANALRAAGHVVETAANGEEAIATAKRAKPNVILMDLAMPHVDGWEAARTIKQDLGMKDTWVVAVTARSDRHDIDRAYAAGCDAVLLKPALPADIVRAVTVGLSRLRGESKLGR